MAGRATTMAGDLASVDGKRVHKVGVTFSYLTVASWFGPFFQTKIRMTLPSGLERLRSPGIA